MLFEQTHLMAANPVNPIAWEAYSKRATQEYVSLLNSNIEEIKMQSFLERNPCFVPGAYGTHTKSGHAPMHYCLFSQPRLPGLATKIPDFMWIAKNSDYINPVLLEIESPQKSYFNKDDSFSANLNQAMTQILDWKAWFEDPANIQVFHREYQIDDRFQFNMRKVRPLFILVYGRTNETHNSQTRADRKAQLSRDNISVMSYDRLSASYDQRFYFCGRVRSDGFEVIEFPEYLKISPDLAENIYRFRGQAQAVKKNPRISIERKDFLLDRLSYWSNWVKSGTQGMRNGGDEE